MTGCSVQLRRILIDRGWVEFSGFLCPLARVAHSRGSLVEQFALMIPYVAPVDALYIVKKPIRSRMVR